MFLHNTYINPAILHILHTLWTSVYISSVADFWEHESQKIFQNLRSSRLKRTLAYAKTGYSYDQCIRYLRLRLSFAMVRSVTISIRGHRGRLRAEGSSGRDDRQHVIFTIQSY
eukprot:sb/3476952/